MSVYNCLHPKTTTTTISTSLLYTCLLIWLPFYSFQIYYKTFDRLIDLIIFILFLAPTQTWTFFWPYGFGVLILLLLLLLIVYNLFSLALWSDRVQLSRLCCCCCCCAVDKILANIPADILPSSRSLKTASPVWLARVIVFANGGRTCAPVTTSLSSGIHLPELCVCVVVFTLCACVWDHIAIQSEPVKDSSSLSSSTPTITTTTTTTTIIMFEPLLDGSASQRF